MEKARRLVRFETAVGPEWTDGQVTLAPIARSIRVGRDRSHPPSPDGRVRGALFARSWPSSVLVSADGRTSRVPIIDVTRSAQVAIILAALVVLAEMWMRTRTRKER